jgi:type III secretion protein V
MSLGQRPARGAVRLLAGLGRADVAVAGLLLVTLALLLLPMPTWVVDVGVAANLSVGLVLLGSALYVRSPRAYGSFPALLLLSTLFRLALNVCSTRLILLQADAGRVIDAFGRALVRGDYAVGGLVFALLTAVQLLVVARGAERVAEVAARFSLDALPGRQLAIEAELRSGLLGAAEVRRARAALAQESDLLGALDGAMKFVKGDALAGLVVAAINAFGGVAIGVVKRGLPLADSAQRYGLLAIGDALASQLPSLLSAAAAGVLVTRMASRDGEGSLAQTIARETLGDVRVLAVAALVLAVLAAMPGLPAFPFALLGCALGALAVRAGRRGAAASAEQAFVLEHGPGRVLDARALAQRHGQLGAQLELPLPPLVLSLAADLAPDGLRARLGAALHPVPADEAAEPLLALERALRRAAPQLVTADHLGVALDALSTHSPRLVREVLPARVGALELCQLMAALVDEGLGFGRLGSVLQALSQLPTDLDPSARLAATRRALAPELSAALAPSGSLELLRLSPELEEAFSDALRGEGAARRAVLPPSLAQDIVEAVSRTLSERRRDAPGRARALLTSAEIRPHVRLALRPTCPEFQVVCAEELAPGLTLLPGVVIGP